MLRKRSIIINGRKTSVSIEDVSGRAREVARSGAPRSPAT